MNNPLVTKNNHNTINILNVMKEAWTLVRGLKWPVFLLIFIFPVAYHVLSIALLFLLIPHNLLLSLPFLLIICCLNFLLLWGCLSLLSILSVRHSIGLPTTLNLIAKQCLKAKDKLFYLFLIWACIMCTLTFIYLFLLPGGTIGTVIHILFYACLIYVSCPLLFFAIPLAITKQTELSTILEESYLAMNRNWIQILVCSVLMNIIIMISAIPFGIGLIWTMPMYYAMTGIIFRDIYGLKKASTTLISSS